MNAAVYALGDNLAEPIRGAVEDLGRRFGVDQVEATSDRAGGAFVVVRAVILPEIYAQDDSWFGMHVTNLHPAADIYPLFVRPDLARSDGGQLGIGFASTTWVHGNQAAMQISRRSPRWDPRRDTPALKLIKVLEWMKDPK